MVETRVTSLGVEALADNPASGSAAAVRVTVLGFEILGQGPASLRTSSLGIELLSNAPGNPGNPRVSSLGIELLSDVPPGPVRTTSLGIEAIADAPKPPKRIASFGLEFLASRGSFQEPLGTVPSGAAFFLHNWANTLRIENSFLTDVSNSVDTGSEERKSLLSKPARALTPTWDVDAERGLRDLIWSMHRQSVSRSLQPLYCDLSVLTSDSSGSFLSCDTSLRRFFVGGIVVLVDIWMGSLNSYQFLTIQQVTDFGLVVAETISPAVIARNGWVLPMVLCEVELNRSLEFLTDALASAQFTFYEVYGPQALVSSSYGLPDGFPLYDGLPILNTKTNWVKNPSLGVSRLGKRYSQGRGQVVSPQAERGSFTQDYSATSETRAEAWGLLRFLESRLGRAGAFWAVGHTSVMDLVSSTSSSLTVTAQRNVEDFQDFLDFVGLEMLDGSIVIRPVSSVTDGGATWTINLSSDLPGSFVVGDVVKATWAIRARNSKDSYTEEWHTLDVCTVEFDVIELLDEKSVATPDLSRATVLLIPVARLRCSAPAPVVTTS